MEGFISLRRKRQNSEYMSTSTLLLFFLCAFHIAQSQEIPNGDFENNSFGNCVTGVTAAEYNTKMISVTAWGTVQHHDAIKLPCSWTPYSGNTNGTVEYWTGLFGLFGYTALSLKTDNLAAGSEYEITFWDKAVVLNPDYILGTLRVDISDFPTAPGTLIGNTNPVDGVWTERSFTFTSPVSGTNYIVVYLIQPATNNKVAWVHLDNFQIALALPVELTSFQVFDKNNNAELHWQTDSETNNQGFEIQRSSDGHTWQTLAFVQGHGTTLEEHSYSHTDRQPLSGLNYYRLRQIDFDGKISRSPVVSVDMWEVGQQVNIFPNPFSKTLHVQLPTDTEGTWQAHLLDVTGKPCWRGNLGGGLQVVELPGLQAGVYRLELENEGQRRMVRVVKF